MTNAAEAASYDTITVNRDDSVAVVTMDRPEAMNAWNWTMAYELSHAYRELDGDDDVRVIVLTGAGRAFCAGAELLPAGQTFDGSQTADDVQARFPGPLTRPTDLRTPVIAAVNGHAVGAGITMALEADIVYVAEDAKLGFVFNRRGIIPDGDLLWSLPRRIGYSRAVELLLTARIFRGREAFELGLAVKALPADDVLAAALETAHDMGQNVAPVSAAVTKTAARLFLQESDQQAASALNWELFQWAGQQQDAPEGVHAFLEKRTPQYTMSKTRDFPNHLLKSDA